MHITKSLDWLGRKVTDHRPLWIRLGSIESKLLAVEDKVTAPVFIAGLARSGSTLLLEILAQHKDVATHRYQDFPFIFTPYWWRMLLALNPFKDRRLRERAHGDGMMVSSHSPEAMEEMLWMAFFPEVHNPKLSQILDKQTSIPEFEKFYRQHIAKLLLAHNRGRYVSKGNYNISRLSYLQKLFPDARFILPVREPAAQIESLMRMHARFMQAGHDPRVAAHMAMVGHFEFGPLRRAIHTGDTVRMERIQAAWDNGDDITGWAMYWDMLYRFVHRQLELDPALKEACLIVRYEDLCAKPVHTMQMVLNHSRLPIDEALIKRFSASIKRPIHPLPFTPQQNQRIADITGTTAKLYGY